MKKVWNKELLEMLDPKDLEITKLKKTIKAFKEYDEKRKKFLQRIQWELEDISEKYCILKKVTSQTDLQKAEEYNKRVSTLRATVRGQQKSIEKYKKIIDLIENDKLERAEKILEKYDVIQLKKLNEDLQSDIGRFRKTNSELVVKIVQLNKQLEDVKNKSIS